MPTPVTWLPWDERAKAKLRRGPHSMKKLRCMPWPFCERCGIIALRNEATRAALKRECVTLADD